MPASYFSEILTVGEIGEIARFGILCSLVCEPKPNAEIAFFDSFDAFESAILSDKHKLITWRFCPTSARSNRPCRVRTSDQCPSTRTEREELSHRVAIGRSPCVGCHAEADRIRRRHAGFENGDLAKGEGVQPG